MMKRNLLFIAAVAAASLLMAALQKPLFMLRYYELTAAAGECAAADIFRVMWHGIKLDISVAGYITALPALVALVATFRARKWFTTLLKVYFVIISAVSAVAFTVNLGLYGYWGFPLDSSIMQFLATPREAAASVTAVEWIAYTAVAAAVCAAMTACYFAVLRLFDCSDRPRNRFVQAAVMLLACGFCFLAIRGVTGVATANISKVYFSRVTFLNHAAVNPLFSFLSTLAHDDKELYQYDLMPEEERAQTFDAIFKGEGCDSDAENGSSQLLTTQRPNIVLFIVESFGCSTVYETVDGVEVAPHFRDMTGNGVYFSNFTANAARTDRGTLAILSGFPAQTRTSVMKDPARSRHMPSIAASLKRAGYATSFYHGGDLNFTNMSSYLYATGFDSLTSLKDMHFDAPTSKWGYADDVTLDDFARKVGRLSQSGQPFFATMLTLSSHEPFDVPYDKFEDRMLNSMAFTDECLHNWIERMKRTPAWDNMLVIIVADHSYSYPYNISNAVPERYRIPMLWTGGAVRGPQVIDTYASQTDLAATLLEQMGLPHDDFRFSRDIMCPEVPHFGYFTFNNGFGVVDSTGATVFDCTTQRVISPDSTAWQLKAGKAILQTTYKSIREMH